MSETREGLVSTADGIKVVKKELDTIDIPKIPDSMMGYMKFRNHVTQAVVTTSCRGQAAYDFIVVVEMKTTTFEELAYCPEMFDSLDMKLLQAILKLVADAKGVCKTIMLEIDQYFENAKLERKRNPDASMLRGRQALWLIYEHFKTTTHDGTLYGFRHLQLVEWKGDEVWQWEYFDAEITRVLGGMENQPRWEDVQDHYVRQFRKTKKMKEDLAYFDRLEPDHVHKSWRYLQRCLRREIFRVRAEKNEDDLCPPDAIKAVAAGGADAKPKGKKPTCSYWLSKTGCNQGDKCPNAHPQHLKGGLSTPTMPVNIDFGGGDQKPPTKEKEKKGGKADGKGKTKDGKGKKKGKTAERAKSEPGADRRPGMCCANKAFWGTCSVPNCPWGHSPEHLERYKQKEERYNADKVKATYMREKHKATAWDIKLLPENMRK